MVSVTETTAEPGSPKKRKRDDVWGKENTLRISQTWKPEQLELEARYTGKPRRQSLEKPTPKKLKSTSSSSSSTPQALTSTSLPNTPFQSPQTRTFPAFPSALRTTGPKPFRCHICHRAEGVSLRVSECGVCERGMCQVCTRICVICDRERCSKCCIEEGEEGDTVCFLCLEKGEEDDGRRNDVDADGHEMVHNGE